MLAKQVLNLLKISRPTLSKYCREGIINYKILPNGRYNYEDKSIYSLLNNGAYRKTIIYARVSTKKQKQDLNNQTELLKNFCFQNGMKIDGIYEDIASGISFENRKQFFKLIDEILDEKIERVIISYKDRLSRIGFDLFENLFRKFGTEIIVMSNIGSKNTDEKEIFQEIISFLHCYSMKIYSKRKNKKIKEIISNES